MSPARLSGFSWSKLSARGWVMLGALVVGVAVLVPFGYGQFFGQKLEARQTSFYKSYDTWWDLVCDATLDGGNEQCYLQYVDVYSPRPDFRAAMMELTYQHDENGASQPRLVFNLEGDLSFEATRLAVQREGQAPLALSVATCSGAACQIAGDAAQSILDALQKGDSLQVTLTERDGKPKILNWPLGNMPDMLSVLAQQRAERGLP